MSPNRILLVVTATLVTLAGGLAVKEHLARSVADRAAAEAESRRVELAAKAQRLQATVMAAEKERTEMQGVQADLRAKNTKLLSASRKDPPPLLNDRIREAA